MYDWNIKWYEINEYSYENTTKFIIRYKKKCVVNVPSKAIHIWVNYEKNWFFYIISKQRSIKYDTIGF